MLGNFPKIREGNQFRKEELRDSSRLRVTYKTLQCYIEFYGLTEQYTVIKFFIIKNFTNP